MANILIVDDKSDNVYYLTALLSGHGFTIASARNGREALEYAHRIAPDLVISDLLMPVMDGYALLRQWKADPLLKTIGFIVYTATYTSPDDERLAHDLGADAFIVKPTDPAELVTCVRRVLGQVEVNAPLVAAQSQSDYAMLDQYNAALVRKLEEKTIQLETTNRALRAEIEERTRLSSTRDAILDSLPAQIALLDHDGTILAVNNTWMNFGLLSGVEAAGPTVGTNYLTVCDLAGKDGLGEAAIIAQGIREVLNGRQNLFNAEYRCATPTRMRWFRIVATSMSQPTLNGAVVTHFEITDVKEAEERIFRTSERLSLAVNAAQIGIWEWSPGKPLVWDDRMYDLYGIPRGEVVDFARWCQLLHPDDVETDQQAIARIAAAGGKREREYRVITSAGETRFFLETERATVRDGSDAVIYVGTNVDNTEQHLHQQEIVDVNLRLMRLISQAPIGIMVFQDFKVVLANDELVRMFGFGDADDLMGGPDLWSLFLDDQRPLLTDYVAQVVQGQEKMGAISLIGLRKDGTPIQLETRAFMIDWAGRASICIMVTDVTEQRLLEQQLRQSQRLEAVGLMTGGVAHDFNNLLTVIMGNGELLERELAGSPHLRDMAEMIIQAADRGAKLADQLLSFSRRQALVPQTIDVNALLGKLQALIKRVVGGGIEIRLHFAVDVLPVLIDPPGLENAILNLSVNARDAMPDGGRLTIETSNVRVDAGDTLSHQDIGPGRYVLIRVSDTGNGMDDATRIHAFDPFFTTKDVGKGSGLGLSMVYGFVRQSLGHIRLQSELGRGTTFDLYLPCSESVQIPLVDVPENDRPSRGHETILVVEDDEFVRVQVCAQLAMFGYQVVSANDGPEALALLQGGLTCDLLFTDVVMPHGISGPQLARAALALRPNLAVLFTSGYSRQEIAAGDGVLDDIHLLNKPYRSKKLAEKVRQVLDEKQA